MKASLLAATAVLSLLSGSACRGGGQASAPPPASSPDEVKKVITQLEHDWVAAILRKDAATISRLLADDYIGTTNDLRYSKAEALQDVQTETYEALDVNSLEVHLFGDTAIVILDQTEKSRHGKEDVTGHYLFTDVWVKTNGQWRAVASHGSSIK